MCGIVCDKIGYPTNSRYYIDICFEHVQNLSKSAVFRGLDFDRYPHIRAGWRGRVTKQQYGDVLIVYMLHVHA
jgi:hypothetical protein